jgi:EAL domain-containing protein (putative c-di-GMP-specific phosphodiesterase class I)/CRP-like cAMP-binding protein
MVDPRKLQAEALVAVENGDFATAAGIYAALERAQPSDGIWPLKLGESLRKIGDRQAAVKALTRALQIYVRQDLRPKAIAVCKSILEIDPRHPQIRQILTFLNETRRDDQGRTPAPAAVSEPEVPAVPEASTDDDERESQFGAPAWLRRAERGKGIHAEVSPATAVTRSGSRLILPRTEFLLSLGEAQLRLVNDRAHLIPVAEGHILYEQNDPSDALFLVASGEVAMLLPQEVARVRRGDFFGEEVAVLPRQGRLATARALEESSVLVLDRDLVRDLIVAAPGSLDILARSLRERLTAMLAHTSPLLAPFSDSQKTELLQRFRFVEVQAHARICEPGEATAGLFVLLAGKAVASLDGHGMSQLGPGDVFGEIPLVTASPVTAAVVASEKCFLLQLSRTEFESVKLTHPEMLEYLRSLAEARVRMASEERKRSQAPRPALRPLVAAPGRVAVMHPSPGVLHEITRALSAAGFQAEGAGSVAALADLLAGGSFDLAVSNLDIPEAERIDLMQSIRVRDLDLPIILTTQDAGLQDASAAMSFGVLHCFVEPVAMADLVGAARRAVQFGRLTRLRREAVDRLHNSSEWMGDQAGLEIHFGSVLRSLWMAFQPVVSASAQDVVAFEALLRSGDAKLPNPMAVLRAAERLRRVHEVGRITRDRVAAAAAEIPGSSLLFVNVHAHDLLDDQLLDPRARLSALASRVFLEITERTPLDEFKHLRSLVARLRGLGYRIAVDNLGAGHAGMASLAELEPDLAKLDISLIRGIDRDSTRQGLVRAMLQVCRDMDIEAVCEGVETATERDALIDLGGDLMQGYFFARPGPGFPAVDLALLGQSKK